MPDIRSFAPAILCAGLIALAGCSPSAPADPVNGANTSGAVPSASADPVPESGERRIVTQEVVSGDAVVVTPEDESDPLFGQEFTVRLLDITAPQEGECGFEAAKAWSEDFFVPANGDPDGGGSFLLAYPSADDPIEPINEAGEHRGALSNSGGHYTNAIREGYAVPNDERGRAVSYEGAADDAKSGKKGVYAECPDFGG